MPSNALNSFQVRLKEIDQLLEAHTALLRFHRANLAASKTSANTLGDIAKIVNHLVAAPGPGRPPQIQALNKAAIALLSGHLQGFVTDLYCEAAAKLLTGHVAHLQSVTESAPIRGNPNVPNITKLFATLGFPDILAGMSWQSCSNQTLLRRLSDFNELRNKIVHGTSITVTKDSVKGYLSSWNALAQRLDSRLGTQIGTITGTIPW